MRTFFVACLLAALPAAALAQDASLARFQLTGALPADAYRLGYWKALATRCDLGSRQKSETLFEVETLTMTLRGMSPAAIDETASKAGTSDGIQSANRDLDAGVDDNPLCDRVSTDVAAALEAVQALRR